VCSYMNGHKLRPRDEEWLVTFVILMNCVLEWKNVNRAFIEMMDCKELEGKMFL
jgi:hypothetical protein